MSHCNIHHARQMVRKEEILVSSVRRKQSSVPWKAERSKLIRGRNLMHCCHMLSLDSTSISSHRGCWSFGVTSRQPKRCTMFIRTRCRKRCEGSPNCIYFPTVIFTTDTTTPIWLLQLFVFLLVVESNGYLNANFYVLTRWTRTFQSFG